MFIVYIYIERERVKFIENNLEHIKADLVVTLGNIFSFYAPIQKSPKFYFILAIPRTYNSTYQK